VNPQEMSGVTFYGYTLIFVFGIGVGPFLILWAFTYWLRKGLEYKYEKVTGSRRFRLFLDILFIFEGTACIITNLSVCLVLIFACSFDLIHWAFNSLCFVYLLPWAFHVSRIRHLCVVGDKGYIEFQEDQPRTNTFDIRNYPRSVLVSLKKKFFVVLLAISFIVVAILLLSSMLYGICICIYPFEFTTTVSRQMSLSGRSIKKSTSGFTYLLLPEDGRTEMILKYQIASVPNETFVFYDTRSDLNVTNYRFRTRCDVDNLSDILIDESRYIVTCGMTGLTPNTTYYYGSAFTSSDFDGFVTSPPRKFKTLSETPMYLFTGDKSMNVDSLKLLKVAAATSPDFIIIGGDISYYNGLNTCYRRLDWFFREWEEFAVTPDGYYIPMLTCIGNHESIDANFGQTRQDAQLYIRAFSHVIGDYGQGTNLTHIHKIGDHSSIAVMDSGVATDFASQGKWLSGKWSRPPYDSTIKYTLYHAGLYPSGRLQDTFHEAQEGLKNWLPIFDQFQVTLSFENHDHQLKRTKILKGNAVSTNGTIYIGDGAFGTLREEGLSTVYRWYMEKVLLEYHFWILQTTATLTNATAVNDNGIVVDRLILNRN
jgi:hypothetical protein